MITQADLANALALLGPAAVFAGNPLVDGGMINVGELEGARSVSVEYEKNHLTLPERTGGVPHQTLVNVASVTISTGLVLNAATASVWPSLSPHGGRGGGHKSPQSVVPTTVLLVPFGELGGGLNWDTAGSQWQRTAGNNIAAAVGAAAAPVNSFWLWRAQVSHGEVPFTYENGTKSVVPITWTGMYDITKPDGHRVYTWGDPRTLTTPILVDL